MLTLSCKSRMLRYSRVVKGSNGMFRQCLLAWGAALEWTACNQLVLIELFTHCHLWV